MINNFNSKVEGDTNMEVDLTPSKAWHKAALEIIAKDSTKQEDREWAAEELKKFEVIE